MIGEAILAVCLVIFCYALAAFVFGPTIIWGFRRMRKKCRAAFYRKRSEWRRVLREGRGNR